MRILHVIRGLANSSGTTHIVGPLAEAQARLGHHVEVFYVDKPGEEAIEPDTRLVQATRFPMSIQSKHWGYSRDFDAEIRRRVSDFHVVHIHAIWNYVTWRAMRAASEAGIPYFVAPQGSLEEWALGRKRLLRSVYAAWIEKPLFDRAAGIQVLTEAEAEQCRAYGIQAPCCQLANGVDVESIDTDGGSGPSVRERYGIPSSGKAMLFLGRIFRKKGLDLLAHAFGAMVKSDPNLTLVVAGHDAGTGDLQRFRGLLEKSEGLKQTIFVGEVRGTEKFELMRACDLFILPSYSEGLPIAALEAMACRLPVVITHGCHIPEVAEVGAGWICDATPSDLKACLQEAMQSSSEWRAIGSLGRRLIEMRFTWPQIAAQSIEIYET